MKFLDVQHYERLAFADTAQGQVLRDLDQRPAAVDSLSRAIKIYSKLTAPGNRSCAAISWPWPTRAGIWEWSVIWQASTKMPSVNTRPR